MKELEILNSIKNTSSKKDKLNLLKENSNNTKLIDLLDATFNFNRKFFIKKIPNLPLRSPQPNIDKHDVFIQLLKDLESGAHRGNNATTMVSGFLNICTDEEFRWYKHIIKKDIKAGFSVKTAVEAGFDLPIFDVKLAKDKKVCKKLDILLAGGGFRSIKYDGYRLVAEIVDGYCTLITRNGNTYENFPMINKALEELFPTGKHMLDGEIMSDDFQSIQSSAFATKRGSVIGDMTFKIFDTVPWDEWESKKFKVKASKRFADLEEWYKNNPHELISLVDHEYGVWTDEEMLARRDLDIAAGHEGTMWEPDIPYYLGKKSNKMLKYKKMKSMEVEITGFYEGEEDTNREGSLGGFYVMQEDGMNCEVGTMRGMTMEDRQHIWDNQGDFINKVFEAEYQELGSKGKMRFPVFIRWRFDK